MKIDLSLNQLKLIKDILLRYLPKKTCVWAFGSRVKGNARRYSDLDLAIDYQGEQCPLSILAQIQYDFEESDLPFKVDIVDWNTLNNNFKEKIKLSCIALLKT